MAVSLGALIRDCRLARGWSQGQLAEQLCEHAGRCTLTREEVSRWERAEVVPGPFWRGFLSRLLDIPHAVIDEEARLSRVNRRHFLNLSALTAVHGKFAAEMVAAIGSGDAGPLTNIQTTHGTDLVIASLADRSSTVRLRRWMMGGSDAILRVNAAGILAKLPGQGSAVEVATVLGGDEETRRLYMTAVLARTCALDWAAAGQLAAHPQSLPKRATFVASRLAKEVLNPRDAGARWCSAAMLRDLSPQLG